MGDEKSTETISKTNPLHPVYTVTNIQNKVRTLDGKTLTYASWVKLFTLHARGYEVLSHIDGTPAPGNDDPSFPSWQKIDSIVLQWIYGTLSDELLERVLENDSTAYEAWNRVKKIFHNNRGPRVAALEQKFVSMKLRNTPSLEVYCQQLKEIAGQLNDLDSPVTEQRLVIQLVNGLPREYDVTGAVITHSNPSWEDAYNILQKERDRQLARDDDSPSPVVAAAVHNESNHRRQSDSRSDSYCGSQRATHNNQRSYNNSGNGNR
ncbi:uncharacterized protein LOC143538207 [Bidens hawaiensis]|uniref:uncharacterized protein LOC143538207 n=1 Tax=Bidens hawaiensis TaxID=980011 RepID=UPI00404B6B53